MAGMTFFIKHLPGRPTARGHNMANSGEYLKSPPSLSLVSGAQVKVINYGRSQTTFLRTHGLQAAHKTG